METWKHTLDHLAIEPLGNIAKAALLSVAVYTIGHVVSYRGSDSLRISQASAITSFARQFGSAIVSTCLGVVVFYTAAVAFGAPFFQNAEKTWWLSVLLSCLCVYPAALSVSRHAEWVSWSHILDLFGNSGSRSSHGWVVRLAQTRLVCTLIGAWIGCLFLPMDWNVKWKYYPLPVAVGAVMGGMVGFFVVGPLFPKERAPE